MMYSDHQYLIRAYFGFLFDMRQMYIILFQAHKYINSDLWTWWSPYNCVHGHILRPHVLRGFKRATMYKYAEHITTSRTHGGGRPLNMLSPSPTVYDCLGEVNLWLWHQLSLERGLVTTKSQPPKKESTS